MTGTQGDLFEDGTPHARNVDPATSHDAAASINVSKQARQVLEAYRYGAPLLDCEAYRMVGFAPGRTSHQRCSDLRDKNFIVRTGERRKTFNGKDGYVCRITPLGLKFLENQTQF